MSVEPLPRLDDDAELRKQLLPYCRLEIGEVWRDPQRGHCVGVIDAAKPENVKKLFGDNRAALSVQDPPYNVAVGAENTKNLFQWSLSEYMAWSKKWVKNNLEFLADDASLYVWLGADQRNGFQPLPDFMLLMREFPELAARSFITMRNQRGYGTQKNWMAVRQECLYYTKGKPIFNIEAEYTDIPKILRGYYKEVGGEKTENLARSKSENIRAGNVWVDVQQVFYRLPENVSGCYAQKPLKCIERIVRASSREKDIVADFFAHSGTTLIAGEMLNRRVFTCDIDPIFAELTIRRLEHFRRTGKTGFQFANPFPEITDLSENLALQPESLSSVSEPSLFAV
ncbi:MAG: site-specific DNA-methyltransferase [Planctomycetota bacterium]|jgi:site-specific DNA-methyltransferase (adenine-specific)|nr:site-specific DNA-methyltransferase [Planctomycetota bacterium]